jgi:hypothetical protein
VAALISANTPDPRRPGRSRSTAAVLGVLAEQVGEAGDWWATSDRGVGPVMVVLVLFTPARPCGGRLADEEAATEGPAIGVRAVEASGVAQRCPTRRRTRGEWGSKNTWRARFKPLIQPAAVVPPHHRSVTAPIPGQTASNTRSSHARGRQWEGSSNLDMRLAVMVKATE